MTTATNSISASVNEPPAEDAPRRLPKLLQLTTTHLIHTYVCFFCLSSFWCWYQFLCYNVLFQWVTDQLNEPMVLLLACHFIAEVWCSHYIALRSSQIKYSMVQLYVS